MIVDADGHPFALKAPDGLPDSVVTALSNWRFKPGIKDGQRVAYALSIIVPVRRTLTSALERSLGRTWSPSGLLIEISDLAKTWDVQEIEERTAGLSSLSDQLEIAHGTASLHALFTGSTEQIRRARVDHLLWMIDNAPELEILGTPAALIGEDGEPLGDSALRQQVAQQWLKQISAFPDSFEVLDHALNFFQFADPQRAVTLAVNTKGWPKAALWLGRVYGLRAVGVTALDPASGLPHIQENRITSTPFEVAARSALLKSDNTKLVLAGLAVVVGTRQTLAKLHDVPIAEKEFCSALLAHAKQLYAKTSLTCDLTPSVFEGNASIARNGASVFKATLNKKTQPIYPQAAKNRKIQGTVTLSAIINREGKY